jgi:molecular chaperone HtpG
MEEEIEQLREEVTILEAQSSRQKRIIANLHEEVTSLKGNQDDTSFVLCFFSMPFRDEYLPLFKAVKSILEDTPYGWKVSRADEEHLSPIISLNIERHISRSHFYIADISDSNPNVFLEIGRMSHYCSFDDKSSYHRPLLYLCQGGKIEGISADLRGHIFHSYTLDTDFDSIADQLKCEFSKKKSWMKDFRTNKKKKIYLSPELLGRYRICEEDLARKISSQYQTVEDLMRQSISDVITQLQIPNEHVSDFLCVRSFLQEHFQMQL